VKGDGFYEQVQAEGSAWQFLATLEEQTALKAAALKNVEGAAPQSQPQRQEQATATRVPSLGPSAGQRVDGDLYAQYQKEVQKLRGGSEAVLQLRRAYRRKGLDI
jgi:hypothetical protein